MPYPSYVREHRLPQDRDSLIDAGVIMFFLILFAPVSFFGPKIGMPVFFEVIVVCMIGFLGYDAAAIRSRLIRHIVTILCMITLVIAVVVHGLADEFVVPVVSILCLIMVVIRYFRIRIS